MTLPDRDAARDWVGRTVVDRDGAEIGVCVALLADEATGSPEWMYAERGEVTEVVPLLGATAAGDRVQVTVSRAEAEDAPRLGAARELSQDQEAELYRHYGIEYSTAASDSLLPAAGAGPAAPSPDTAGAPEPARDTEQPPAEQSSPAQPSSAQPSPAQPSSAQPSSAQPSSAQRGRGLAGALAVLAGLAAVVVVTVRLRRRPAWVGRVRRRRAPAPAPAPYRALAGAAGARAGRYAAAAGPVLQDSVRLAREGASIGAVVTGRLAVDAAERARQAATVARTRTDAVATQLTPVLSAAGQAAWRAARTGTGTALRATDAALLAVGAALPQAGAGVGRALTTGVQAALAVGAVPEVLVGTGERLGRGWRRTVRRTSLVLGLGTGYVLGARAGRARYEEIARAAGGVVARPEVQQVLAQVRDVAPAPLQDRIDRLTGRGAGRDAGAATVAGGPAVATPSRPASGTRTPQRTDPPLPDPLVPPAKSPDGGPTASR
ncbi:hypothetical protein SAMN06893096_10353 [Geodermatophilus pulveris]|uniref:PRC-barrel domain-containing protein n=1 Tax=Geodermatophilus pulveris TaxID=1564159 RepID=A0A239D7S3_9ACTN|nr:hypothetical protein [Geodermatophilus pulveris]SNS28329.1 hypothetical protein SAMN06893096_10353 [Geodermatophilus pulveris]